MSSSATKCIERSHTDALCVRLKQLDLCADDAAAALAQCAAVSQLTHVHMLECTSLNAPDGVAALMPLMNHSSMRALTLTDANVSSDLLVNALAQRDTLTLLVLCNFKGEGSFVDAMARWVHHSTSLRRLVLDSIVEPHRVLCQKVLESVAQSTVLRELVLWRTQFGEDVALGFAADLSLSKSTSLESFGLWSCELRDWSVASILHSLARLPALRQLDVQTDCH
jgi:hypothetical protein